MVNSFKIFLFNCLLFNFNQLFISFSLLAKSRTVLAPIISKVQFLSSSVFKAWSFLHHLFSRMICMCVRDHTSDGQTPLYSCCLLLLHPCSRFSRTHCKMFLLREGTVTQLYWSHITSASTTNDTFASSNGCSTLVVLSGALTSKSWEKLGRFLSCFV